MPGHEEVYILIVKKGEDIERLAHKTAKRFGQEVAL